MDPENLLPIHDSRIMPNVNDEKSCAYGCQYCFATNNDFLKDPNRPEPMALDDARQRVMATIAASDGAVQFVNSACSREIFEDESAGIEHVRFLASCGENVSFPTKTALSDGGIDALAEINRQLGENGKKMALQVSFVSADERPELESRTPPVDARIAMTRKLVKRGIGVGIYIRPVLPPSIVPTDQILRLVDKTAGHIRAYTVGAEMYFTDNIARKLGMDPSSPEMKPHTQDSVALAFSPSETKWSRYVDPREQQIMEYIREKGRVANPHSGATLDYLISE